MDSSAAFCILCAELASIQLLPKSRASFISGIQHCRVGFRRGRLAMYNLRTGPTDPYKLHFIVVRSVFYSTVSVIFYGPTPRIYAQSVTANYDIATYVKHVPEAA